MQDTLKIPSRPPEDMRPTPDTGLTEAQADQRRRDGLSNTVTADPGKSVWQILWGNLFNLFNMLNFALAACLVLVGSYRNMLFLGVVFSNTLIGTVQELRAKRTIERLRVLSAPEAHALREGREITCRPEELVQDDLVILRAGDQVLADAIVRTGTGAADESLLTGESDPVEKHDGDWLMSGSYITEGRFVAQLVHVGDESYAARLTHAAKAIKRPKSALMTEMNKLLRFVSAILLPLGAALFCKQYFLTHELLNVAVPSTVAAMIGMIPEGLILLTSMALAVGVVKLGRRQTLVQELYGIETLARADVLCLDKTGTITTGRMQVEELVPMGCDEAVLRDDLSRFLGAFDEKSGTLEALRAACAPGMEAPLRVEPFSSKTKKSSAVFADGAVLTLGAPEFVLGDSMPDSVRVRIRQAAESGLRVLVLMKNDALAGLIFLSDEIRENAADTLRYFREQDVTVKIISGDDPRTVSAIAHRVALPGWDSWVDATTLTTDKALRKAAEKYTVFGRVTPRQKCLLVEALKAAGHSVAMTGDGVNDIPALKAADCSIAMAGGADAAKNAAQLTLLDADFSAMPQVVCEGRRVVNNITRAASLFLVKTLYSFALSVVMLLLPVAYPFQPIQLTLISALTVGTPSFFLAMEPDNTRISGNFLQSVLTRALPGAAAVTVCAAAAMLLEKLGMPQATCSVLATLSAGLVGLMSLARVCWPFTAVRAAVLLAMTIGMAGAVAWLGPVFFLDVRAFTLPAWLALAALAALGVAVMLLAVKAMGKRKLPFGGGIQVLKHAE